MTQTHLHILKLIQEAKDKGLKALDLSYGITQIKLSQLSPELFELKHLEHLDLRGQEITILPDGLAHLTNLTVLDLNHNNLTTLPDGLTQLINLTTLDLSNNDLTALPDGLAQLISLTTLDLRANKLTALPEGLAQLTSLTTLDLSFNKLTALPDSPAQLTALTTLDLSFNKLIALSDWLTQFTNLTALGLSNNGLATLPDALAQLTSLTTLDLSFNKLTALPDRLTQLTNLTYLYLAKNPIETPPLEVLNLDNRGRANIENIRNYFRQLREAGVEHLYEAKLLIIGEAGAGKTSLAKKILTPAYQLVRNEASTEGIGIVQWGFSIESGQHFRVNIWDFGGQEIYHATHQFFLTKRSLYALVADTRKEDTDFYYWLKVVELFSDNSPLLIIKNEKQDRHFQINEPQLREQFNHFKETLTTNLATNRGLEPLRDSIKYHISHLPHIGDALPKTWVNVRQAAGRQTPIERLPA
jgi:internalin A